MDEFIEKSVVNLANQRKREDDRIEKHDKLDEKLIKLFEKLSTQPDFEKQFAQQATDLMLAYLAQEIFEEIDRAEDDLIDEYETFEKMDLKDLEEMEFIDTVIDTEILEEQKKVYKE